MAPVETYCVQHARPVQTRVAECTPLGPLTVVRGIGARRAGQVSVFSTIPRKGNDVDFRPAQCPNSRAAMSASVSPAPLALGFIGAAVGAALGYAAFFWAARQGFYAIVLPPALLGLGAGLGARRRSRFIACVAAVAGLALGLFVEWKFSPFVVDQSLAYFVTHLHTLRPLTILMIVLGGILSYRLALGFEAAKS